MSPKTPEEWREYRRVNRVRINETRRRKKQEKLESEKFRLMKPLALETAALPAKTGQQSISAVKNTDTASVAQFRSEQPAQTAQESGFAMASGISFQAQVPRQAALWVVPEPGSTTQTAQDCEAPELHEGRSCAKVTKKQSALLIRKQAEKPFLTYFFSLCIIIFLGFNTAFLVLEQSGLYTSLGYSGAMAMMIALLTECALVLFSALASWAPGWIWKAGLYAGCLVTGFVVFNLLSVSVENRASKKLAGSEQAEILKKEIATFETLETAAIASIKNLNPSLYPTKINRLMAKLNAPGPEGFTFRLGKLREKLAGLSASGSVQKEIQVLQWQRWAAMLWNFLLAGFLGFLWRKKEIATSGILKEAI